MHRALFQPRLFVTAFRALPAPNPLAMLTYQSSKGAPVMDAEELPLDAVADKRIDLAAIVMHQRGPTPALTWDEWQFIALEILRRHGFAVERLPTQQGFRGPDGIVVYQGLPPNLVVEAKRYKKTNPISRADIEQLAGYCKSAQTPFGIIVTTSADAGRHARQTVGAYEQQGFRFFLFRRRDIQEFMIGLAENDPLRRALEMALDATDDWA